MTQKLGDLIALAVQSHNSTSIEDESGLIVCQAHGEVLTAAVVSAINAHDALVEALKATQALLEPLMARAEGERLGDIQTRYAANRAALKLAGEP